MGEKEGRRHYHQSSFMETGQNTQRSLNNIMSNKHYVYILKCSDNTYYTGYTNDVTRRIKLHNEGKGAKYTRGRTPVQLVYEEMYETKTEALKREYEIKQLRRTEKERLIAKKESRINNVDTEKL